MGFDKNFDEKIDVIDLIINVLRDHEKKLDELVSRLEETQLIETPLKPKTEKDPQKRILLKTLLRSWQEFKHHSTNAKLVTYDLDKNIFTVSALSEEDVLYTYSEEIPKVEINFRYVDEKINIDGINISKAELVPVAMRGELECGLKLTKKNIEVKLPNGSSLNKIIYDINNSSVKSWLSSQLGIVENIVLYGKFEI